MRVHYVGASEKSWGGYLGGCPMRIAEIVYEREELPFAEAVASIMEKNGWEGITLDGEMGYCEVADRDEFEDFMADWKAAKKSARRMRWTNRNTKTC